MSKESPECQSEKCAVGVTGICSAHAALVYQFEYGSYSEKIAAISNAQRVLSQCKRAPNLETAIGIAVVMQELKLTEPAIEILCNAKPLHEESVANLCTENGWINCMLHLTGICILHELLENSRRRGKLGELDMVVDMSKAFQTSCKQGLKSEIIELAIQRLDQLARIR
jgi:hypothetical protein